MSKWVLLFVVYIAPDDAVNWDGPWEAGVPIVREEFYDSQAECLRFGAELKRSLQEGMRAPIRYQCIEVPASLPEGAPR